MAGTSPGELTDGRLRRYEPRDRDAVWGLHRTALSDAGTDPADVPDTDDLRDVPSHYLDPGGEFLVCEVERDASGAAREAADGSDGAVVAMGGLVVDGEDRSPGAGELLRIAVHPDRQREGHGSAVVAGLEAAARERGLDRVVLWTAQRQRAAVRFYTARGYEGIDHRTEGEYELLRFEKSLDGD